jgi:hypothetical protein
MNTKTVKSIAVVILVFIIGLGLLGVGDLFSNPLAQQQPGDQTGNANPSPATQDPAMLARADAVPCFNSFLPMPPSYHIHPVLKLKIDGADVPVPPNIGINPSCEKVLHTHDSSGELHVEPNYEQVFTLADFFALWGKPFSKTELLDKKANDTHEVVMTVDGQANTEFENLVLRDKQQILLEYRVKSE